MRLSRFPMKSAPVRSAVVAAAVVALLPAAARADVRYTSEMHPTIPESDKKDMPAGMGVPVIRMTTMMKDGNERAETDVKMGPMSIHRVTLTLCGKKQSIQLDNDLKIFTAGPIGGVPGAGEMQKLGRRPGPPKRNKGGDGEGKVVNTFKVTDLGEEKVGNLTAHHAMLDMTTESSGCAGDEKAAVKMETWVAPIKGGRGCPDMFTESRTEPGTDGCHITTVTKGDMDKLITVFGGAMVKMKLFDKDNKVIMSSELKDYSEAELDPALFAVPSGYKEVTQAEFDKQQQSKMMKSMMGGAGMGPGSDTPGMDADTQAAIADAQRQAEEAQKQAEEAQKNQQQNQDGSGESEHSGDGNNDGQQSGEEKKDDKKKGIKIPKIKLPF